ncbi:putative membrane protein YvbJ [Fontibacillus solani]|uniref:Uncharacterized protein n=2 Tax=Fontibacillus TaxID=995014 RepID=A0A1G7MVK9_9BACL|nr:MULTISPECIES: hypothetical protein [Fontibacillus]MBA9086344.1 putative membrane protein YvbJ [Fontibacillus solani]SDF65727.1 hypothetical protein SAMN04488542_114104 [Fontibacillus panacisegetis]
MSTKRKSPTLQQKRDEVNKKALVWASSVVGALIILVTIVIILANL